MNKQGCILIVEDREDWRKTLVEELQRAHFQVNAVESIDKARQALASALYHVLILDIRLNESDTSNTDGLKLLQELDKNGMTDAIQVVMLTAVGTRDQMRISFRDYKVADFIFKKRSHSLIADVQRVFDEKARINLNMDIRWSAASSAELAVAQIKLQMHDDDIKNTRVLPGMALQKRVAAELDDLLRRLFCQAESILVKPMSAGRSGAGVLGVRPFYSRVGGGSPVVVKFGSTRKILQEYKNFKEYVEPLVGGKRCTNVYEVRSTPLLGGLIYSFLGAGDRLEDFGAFYHRSEISQIKQVLDQLFLNTCIDWYANASRLQLLDLTEDYQRLLHFTPEKLESALQQLRIIQEPEEGLLFFTDFPNWKPLKDPLRAMDGRSLAFPTYTSPTHGDFNQHNLLVDKDGYIWMIDFQGTGQGHILRDLASLDSVIRFQLLSATETTLEECLEMEQALCSISHFSQVDQLPGKFQTRNPVLGKAYAISVHLRVLARHMVRQNPNDDFSEYYTALFYNALNTIRFRGLEQGQREYAQLSACLLVDHLDLKE